MPSPIPEIPGIHASTIPDALLRSPQPVVLRGLVGHWPAVQAGLASSRTASDYLLQFYRGTPVEAKLAPPEARGRFFYNDDLTGFNFQIGKHRLDAVLNAIEEHASDDAPPGIYVGATMIDHWLPGFRADNDVALGDRKPLASIWIGNRSVVCAHYDVPDNLACVVAGHRRFTLFPPSQIGNLYIGPIDFHPAGQAISLVDFAAPDFARFPKFAEALEHAQVAELGPGDAVFIPGMWWHHIEALDRYNVLVNYWWRQAAAHLNSPINALMLAMLGIRDLPSEQREAWQAIFRHYVFEAGAGTTDHIPEHARSVLAPLDARSAESLLAQLLKRLGR